ncbi:hypothetical protein CVT24_011994 [Panaeolus cyanescens]|uniref:Phenylacetyl-CoA ligase n=1 Tax=Panaeolus cyanescens TaxID=181874 RepID=A0A409VHP8_9AGAR|nr:hypothetical protein CVT24_011994 [Panaeolus cyanescens]
MSEFRSTVPLPPIPDDISIPQFILRSQCTPRPQRPRNVPFFIEDGTGRTLSYEEVHKRTYNLANGLSIKWDIAPKDVVCLFSPNHMDYASVIWAVHTLGGIITQVPANPSYTVDELKHQLSLTSAKLIVAHPSCLRIAKAAARDVGIPDDCIVLLDAPSSSKQNSQVTLNELIALGGSQGENYRAVTFKPGESRTTIAFLSFSSGTTGKPKAVAVPHYAVIANVIQMATHFRINDPQWPNKRLQPGDVNLAVLPFFHIYGLIVILHLSLFYGASLVVVPKFSFIDFLRSIVRFKITHLFLVPPQVVLLCKHPAVKRYNLEHVKFCLSGAAPLSGELMKQIANVLPNAVIGQGYGMTETATTVCMIPPDRKMGTIGSAGELTPGITARVVKPDGSLANEGEQGELVVKGPSMALGYYKNPQATAESFIDGWVRTGDEVIIKNLEIYVVDRLKEIMKVRGFQVAPAELEGHLLLHNDVTDVCVVGIPDDYSGEVPLAFVVRSAQALARTKDNEAETLRLKKSLQKHVADAKIHYKHLVGGVEFVDAIPKNPSGKILRRVLRDKAKTLPRQPPVEAKL